jgi:WD repeat-containing protein 26
VSAWFASERWTFFRHEGEKWLSDVIGETKRQVMAMPGVAWFRKRWKEFLKYVMVLVDWVKKGLGWVVQKWKIVFNKGKKSEADMAEREKSVDDLEANTLPVRPAGFYHYHAERLANISTGSEPRPSDVTSLPASPGPEAASPSSPTPLLRSATEPPSSAAAAGSVLPVSASETTVAASTTGTTTDATAQAETRGKLLWRNAMKTVKMRSAVSSNLAALAMNAPGHPALNLGQGTHSGNLRNPMRQRTTSSTMTSDSGSASAGGSSTAIALSGRTTFGPRRQKTVLEEPVMLRSRVAMLIPKLKGLDVVQDIPAHQALVRHLQFSPDGKFLATSSWDRTSVIFRVAEPQFVTHRILAHTKGFVGQVAWAPTGNMLLTKLIRGIKVWNEVGLCFICFVCCMITLVVQDGVCQKTIDRPTFVESITWHPDADCWSRMYSAH